MNLMRGLVVFLVLGPAWSAVAESPEHFRFWKQVERDLSQEEEIVAFVPDSDVYAATRDGIGDLRLVDQEQTETPYHIEHDVEYREEKSRQPFAAEVVSLQEAGLAIEIRLRLPEKSPTADGLRIATPLTDFERTVQVAGSPDGVEWTPLVSDAILFDYSRYMNVTNREIALPENRFREFKLVIHDVTDEKESPYKELARTFRGGREDERLERTSVQSRPLRIDRIEAWHNVTRERVRKVRTAEYPAGFEMEQDSVKKRTLLDVRTRREPITQFTLETPGRNFSRRVVIEAPVVRGVRTQWQQIGEATIYSFHLRNVDREEMTISFPEQRREQYRIVIDNEDNPPLEVTKVKASGNVYRVVFLAQPSRSYRVFYGSEMAEPPKYETASVLAALRRDYRPAEATLGPQVLNTGFGGEPGFVLRKLLDNWIFLGTVIGLMVVVLGWALFRAGRRLEGLPKD